MAPELDEPRIARWARHLLVPGFGAAGQERLMGARVRAIGADGPSTPALVALVEAGVGTLWIDDPDLVAPADRVGWLYRANQVGLPRASAATEALLPLSRFVTVQPFPAGGVPTATLVCASSSAQALAAAEVARRARIPHVVLEVDGEGGSIVTVPVGAPCFSCGRFTATGGRPPVPGALPMASLAAQELLQLMVDPAGAAGRRIDVVRGVPSARPTARLPGCACGQAEAPPVEP